MKTIQIRIFKKDKKYLENLKKAGDMDTLPETFSELLRIYRKLAEERKELEDEVKKPRISKSSKEGSE